MRTNDILKAYFKVRKLSSEQGVKTAIKKIGHLAAERITQAPVKKTLLKRDAIFRSLEKEVLRQDVEHLFSVGLFRALEDIKGDIRTIPIDLVGRILQETRELIGHSFTIYGQLKVEFGVDQFSWLRDPLTDFVWPSKWSTKQIINQKPYGTDVKNIWEVARFQFLSTLAQSYIFTDEEQYPCFAINKINSWIDENPFPYGPHWSVAMEASIRLINWCVYLPLLDIFKYADLSFKNKITQSILEHLIFIRENLEVSPSQAGNHYLADLVGLLLAQHLFPSLESASEFSELGIEEFEKEVGSQFKSDGINFEGSLPYHRLCSEMCLIGLALIKKSGKDVPIGIIKRLREAAKFTKYYADACEECPTIGDNDSGVFVRFFPGQELNRHQYLNTLFECILDDKSQPNDVEEFLCSVHFLNSDRSISSDTHQLNDIGLQVRDFNGLVIARHESEALFFNTLHSSEGHTHNDKLSLYPIIGRKSVFVDRGSFSYTGFIEKRHEDRKSSSHNGPVINGWEQNRIWKEDPFYVNGDAKCSNTIELKDKELNITGWHSGYGRFRRGLKVYRKITWDTKKHSFLITDWIEGPGRHETFQLKWLFLISPEWVVVKNGKTLVLTGDGQIAYFDLLGSIDFRIGRSTYYPSYQLESPCQSVTASRKVCLREKISFRLRYGVKQ